DILFDFDAAEYTVYLSGLPLATTGLVDRFDPNANLDRLTDADLAALAMQVTSASQMMAGTAYFDNFRILTAVTGALFPADGNRDGVVDHLDLALWRDHFGQSHAGGATAALASMAATAPDPQALQSAPPTAGPSAPQALGPALGQAQTSARGSAAGAPTRAWVFEAVVTGLSGSDGPSVGRAPGSGQRVAPILSPLAAGVAESNLLDLWELAAPRWQASDKLLDDAAGSHDDAASDAAWDDALAALFG
ncbi:MAG TPA: hypothetical protein PJ982_12965, partial [Lacipirellulaceae bacterium]|nr:hypothetical protein [Lacipirellulaceae bacterium]